MLTLCVAMDKNRLIGNNNALLWHLPADLKHFRAVTMGKPIIMGHKTYLSIGRPLPGRLNVVLSHDRNLSLAGCEVLHCLQDVLVFSQDYEECVVIGGASVYEMLLEKVERMYLTQIHATFVGDTYFPDYELVQWRVLERLDCQADAKNAYPYSFIVLERR